MENGDGKMIIDLALSSLSYVEYAQLMREFNEACRLGETSAADMGL